MYSGIGSGGNIIGGMGSGGNVIGGDISTTSSVLLPQAVKTSTMITAQNNIRFI